MSHKTKLDFSQQSAKKKKSLYELRKNPKIDKEAQPGDILQSDQSNENYLRTHGVSGVDWRFYKSRDLGQFLIFI